MDKERYLKKNVEEERSSSQDLDEFNSLCCFEKFQAWLDYFRDLKDAT
jgi:hypothetical protein